jgi:hypothetical protein
MTAANTSPCLPIVSATRLWTKGLKTSTNVPWFLPSIASVAPDTPDNPSSARRMSASRSRCSICLISCLSLACSPKKCLAVLFSSCSNRLTARAASPIDSSKRSFFSCVALVGGAPRAAGAATPNRACRDERCMTQPEP